MRTEKRTEKRKRKRMRRKVPRAKTAEFQTMWKSKGTAP